MNMQPIYPLLNSFSTLLEFFCSPFAHFITLASDLKPHLLPPLVSAKAKGPFHCGLVGVSQANTRESVRAHELQDGALAFSVYYAFPY